MSISIIELLLITYLHFPYAQRYRTITVTVLTLNVYIKENNWWPLLYFNKIVSNGQLQFFFNYKFMRMHLFQNVFLCINL